MEFTEVEEQAIYSVFTDEIERLDQEDKGAWCVAQWIGYWVFQEVAKKAGRSNDTDGRAEPLVDTLMDCFAFLVNDERPEEWDDLPIREKMEADDRARERATKRWQFSHPNNRHDGVRWAQETGLRKAI